MRPATERPAIPPAAPQSDEGGCPRPRRNLSCFRVHAWRRDRTYFVPAPPSTVIVAVVVNRSFSLPMDDDGSRLPLLRNGRAEARPSNACKDLVPVLIGGPRFRVAEEQITLERADNRKERIEHKERERLRELRLGTRLVQTCNCITVFLCDLCALCGESTAPFRMNGARQP